MITAESNRQRPTHDPRLQKSLERHLAWLQHELREIDRDLDGTVRGTPAWRETEDLLASVPGIGPITAVHHDVGIAALEVPIEDRFAGRAPASPVYLGESPILH